MTGGWVEIGGELSSGGRRFKFEREIDEKTWRRRICTAAIATSGAICKGRGKTNEMNGRRVG